MTHPLLARLGDDPRLRLDHVRTIERTDAGDIVLAGVVHDHPASVYRVQKIIRTVEPGTVALELPRLALRLFEVYAEDDRSPPEFGGEMSGAIQAAGDADIVGIDAPNRAFLVRLLRAIVRERPSLATVRRVLRGVSSVTRHALVCRLAAAVASRTSMRVEVDAPVQHDCAATDAPNAQATDERRQITTSFSLLRAAETPQPVRLRDETREECMVQALDALDSSEPVVAVVGVDHLERIASKLDDSQ